MASRPFENDDLELEGYEDLGFARGSRKIVELLEQELGSLARLNVLDLGCGFGEISLALARKAKKVTSVDRKDEELAHIERWKNEKQITNLDIVRASAIDVPLQSHSFDLVLLNGVLEWIGHADSQGSPEKLQRQALQEVVRLLKPEGVLYLAIENRYYPPHLWSDPHTHQPLVSFLPRYLADKLSYMLKGQRYDVYTHSRRHLQTMLQDAGFRDIRFHIAVTNYYLPAGFAGIDDKRTIRRLLDSLNSDEGAVGIDPRLAKQMRGRYGRQKILVWKLMLSLNLLSMFGGAFVVLASPASGTERRQRESVLSLDPSPSQN